MQMMQKSPVLGLPLAESCHCNRGIPRFAGTDDMAQPQDQSGQPSARRHPSRLLVRVRRTLVAVFDETLKRSSFEIEAIVSAISASFERRVRSSFRSKSRPNNHSSSAIELTDVNDPKFALRIFADPKIEGRIAMGIVGTVRNGPIEWLIHDKQIGIARPHHFSRSAGRPFPDGPLIVVTLRRSLNIR
jgi:hypothetical protein